LAAPVLLHGGLHGGGCWERCPLMRIAGHSVEACPFEFNFEPATFKLGHTVSYRVNGSLSNVPFVGTLIEVGDDYVVIS